MPDRNPTRFNDTDFIGSKDPVSESGRGSWKAKMIYFGHQKPRSGSKSFYFENRHSSSRLKKKCSSDTKIKVSFSLWLRLNMRFLLHHNETNDLGEPKAPRVFNKE